MFTIGDKVHIDGCCDLTATVTAIQVRGHSATGRAVSYEVSFVSNGDAKAPWIEEFRLSNAEA